MLDLDTEFLSPTEAARVLRLSVQRIAQLAAAGRLPYTMTPLGKLYARRDVEDLARQRQRARAGGAA